jgi:hypothetical protein
LRFPTRHSRPSGNQDILVNIGIPDWSLIRNRYEKQAKKPEHCPPNPKIKRLTKANGGWQNNAHAADGARRADAARGTGRVID